jgi:hypothetical protein
MKNEGLRIANCEEGTSTRYVHIPYNYNIHGTIPSRVNVWGRWRRESERSLKRKETSIFQS